MSDDLNVYVMIDLGGCASTFKLKTATAEHGFWSRAAPASIEAGTILAPDGNVNKCGAGLYPICLAWHGGYFGSEGTLSYTTDDDCTVTMRFCDSFGVNGNYGDITIDKNPGNRYTLSGQYWVGDGIPRYWATAMPPAGHPVFCWFVIRTNDPPVRK
jgi:hypothetical protein